MAASRTSDTAAIPKGRLILIGGAEDRENEMAILKEVVSDAHSGRIAVVTAASSQPAELWSMYRRIFEKLGAREVVHVDIQQRNDAYAQKNIELLSGVKVIFFTGGDQVRITSNLGGSPMCDSIRNAYVAGATLAGTSAGTSCMSETMIVGGPGEESHKVGSVLFMAPGLGIMTGVIVDQHFAERGRVGRLLGAVAQNPRILGIGIDEDTAIVVKSGRFRVFGAGAVYVIDAISESYTNLSETGRDRVMSLFDVRLHIMSTGDTFDLATRRPAGADSAAQKGGTTQASASF